MLAYVILYLLTHASILKNVLKVTVHIGVNPGSSCFRISHRSRKRVDPMDVQRRCKQGDVVVGINRLYR